MKTQQNFVIPFGGEKEIKESCLNISEWDNAEVITELGQGGSGKKKASFLKIYKVVFRWFA